MGLNGFFIGVLLTGLASWIYLQQRSSETNNALSNPPQIVLHHTQERIVENSPDVQIPLRRSPYGMPPEFHQIGTLSTEGTILPLYGRPRRFRDWKWLYYTSTDGYNALQIPLLSKGKDCMGEFGCEELSTGDLVEVPQMGKTFTVNLYRVRFSI